MRVFIAVFCFALLTACGDNKYDSNLPPYPSAEAFASIDIDGLISARSAVEKNKLREELRKEVWGYPTLPIDKPIVRAGQKTNYHEAEREELLILDMGNAMVSVAHLMYPRSGNNKLVIYHAGHSDSILRSKYIKRFLEEGYAVLAIAMPLKHPNSAPYFDHDAFIAAPKPLQYFFTPIAVGLNYAADKFTDVYMVGLSGGGWTTVVYAALDGRIKKSYVVAGTAPKFIAEAHPRNMGDFEQQEIRKRFEYLDLYVLAGRQMQIFNLHDTCCFGGTAALAYASAVAAYSTFKVVVDDSEEGHLISPFAMRTILEDMDT